jgi:aldehyde dehydrogenase (NAD+)
VQSSIKDKFVARLLELARSAKIGNPMQSDTNIGPITTPAQYKEVLDYIEVAKAEGARCLLGGKPASGDGIVGGQFVEPTIFTDVDNSMRIARRGLRAGPLDHQLRHRGRCHSYR